VPELAEVSEAGPVVPYSHRSAEVEGRPGSVMLAQMI